MAESKLQSRIQSIQLEPGTVDASKVVPAFAGPAPTPTEPAAPPPPPIPGEENTPRCIKALVICRASDPPGERYYTQVGEPLAECDIASNKLVLDAHYKRGALDAGAPMFSASGERICRALRMIKGEKDGAEHYFVPGEVLPGSIVPTLRDGVHYC